MRKKTIKQLEEEIEYLQKTLREKEAGLKRRAKTIEFMQKKLLKIRMVLDNEDNLIL